jgi:hypothetical protein
MIFAGGIDPIGMFVCERKSDNVITGYLLGYDDAIE